MWWEDNPEDGPSRREAELIELSSGMPGVSGVGRLRTGRRTEAVVVLDSALDPRRAGRRWIRAAGLTKLSGFLYDRFGPLRVVHLGGRGFTGGTVEFYYRRRYETTDAVARMIVAGPDLARQLSHGDPKQSDWLRSVLSVLGTDVLYLFLPLIKAAGRSYRVRSVSRPALPPGTAGCTLKIGDVPHWLTAGHVVEGDHAEVKCYDGAFRRQQVRWTGRVCYSADPEELPRTPGLDYAVFEGVPTPSLGAVREYLRPGTVLTPAEECLVWIGTSSGPRRVHFTNVELTVSAETPPGYRVWKALWLMEARRWAARPGDSGCEVHTLRGILTGHLVGVTRASGFGRYRICLVQDAYTVLTEIRAQSGQPVEYCWTHEG